MGDPHTKHSRQISLCTLTRPRRRYPGLLTTDLCSLVGGLERRAFSVLWEITPDFDILEAKTRFCKSVIKSSAAMTYEAAQLAIDDSSRSDACARDLR
jgi:exosome complex exonuclease DIS3/RRP44